MFSFSQTCPDVLVNAICEWLPGINRCPCPHQAAIGSTALDMARTKDDKRLQKYGMDVLTVAVLAILFTAPIGALIIGLAGPRLLQKPKNSACGERVKPTLSAFFLGR